MKPVVLALTLVLAGLLVLLASSVWANPPSIEDAAGNVGAIMMDMLSPPGSKYYPSPDETQLNPDLQQPAEPSVEIKDGGVRKIPMLPGGVTQTRIHGQVAPGGQ